MWHRKLYHVFLEHYHDTQNTYVVQTMSVDEVQQGAHRQFMTFSDNKTVLMAEICCKPQCSTSKCISQWEVHYGSSLGPTDGRKSSSVHRWVLLHTVNTHSHWQFIISCQYSQSCLLAIWRPLVPYGHSYKASTARLGEAIIWNFWHPGTLTLSPDHWVPRCQKLQMVA